jgi:hypothetical protein
MATAKVTVKFDGNYSQFSFRFEAEAFNGSESDIPFGDAERIGFANAILPWVESFVGASNAYVDHMEVVDESRPVTLPS